MPAPVTARLSGALAPTRPPRRSLRSASALAVGAAAAAALSGLPTVFGGSGPALAAGARPVSHSLQTTYRAVTTRPGDLAPAAHVRHYYFAGTQTDQAAKVAGRPTATFTTARPAGSSPIVQLGTPASSGGDGLDVSWAGPLHASIAGPLVLHVYAESADALADLATLPVTLSVIADAGSAHPTTLVDRRVDLTVSPSSYTANTLAVYVKGKVAKTLTVRLLPIYVDESEDLRIAYGAATAPSGFDLPLGVTPPASGPTTVPVKTSLPPLTLGASYVGRNAAEPTIGVTKSGTAYFVASTFDSVVGGEPRTEVLRSTTGTSWRDVSPTLAGATTYPPVSLDPYIYVDPVTGRIFSDDLSLACSTLIYSDDGESWSTDPVACEAPVDDHQTIVAGPFPKGITPTGTYPRAVYYCVNKIAAAECAISTDGGASFRASGTPAFDGLDLNAGGFCGSLFGHIATDSAGRLFLPKGHCGNPWLAISSDGGQTWQRVKVSNIPAAGIQTAVAVDAADNVYYVWWDAKDNLPYLSVSRDHGQHWSTPVEVAPPGTQAVNFPSISASGVGRIAISYPATSAPEKMGDFRPWNYVVTESLNALDPTPTFFSATANPASDPIHRGACSARCAGMYDFLDVLIDPHGRIWASATDTCTALDHCSTNNGPTEPKGKSTVANDAQGVAVRELSGPETKGRPAGAAGAAAPALTRLAGGVPGGAGVLVALAGLVLLSAGGAGLAGAAAGRRRVGRTRLS